MSVINQVKLDGFSGVDLERRGIVLLLLRLRSLHQS